ncbi:aminopeptidase [Sphingomonas sp. Root710]|uniref:leucyl aminopeptidase n=1 Tax=Sphingomonas sp. Root710 TaxID=1736594 RepID=UPI0006F3124F|nr:leucyl aminopeptidase [Sphingomonas sp. Root710]KRB85982.1 aminopeptidase [Sphingomonas sp. Root710]
MRISFADSRPAAPHALAIVVAPATISGAGLAVLSEPAQALARAAAQANRFDGENGAVVEFFGESDAAHRRLLLAGIGSKNDYERAGAALAARLLTSGEKTLVVDIAAVAGDKPAEAAASLAFGAVLRSWRHDVYRTKLEAKQRPSLEEIVIVGGGADAAGLWKDREAVAEGVMFTRTLITEPANILYPESFVERCRPLADLGVKIEVLGRDAMAELGMGALLGVAQGSVREPQLLVMTWDGTNGAEPPVALVGKGVTFDTGGISIKPAGGMEDMKWDMGGAGAVAGMMKALALRKAKAHVIGVCGLVENMPDGNAQRPGDVVTSMSGQTVEVINTDAEGRLVLCDALTWVQKTHSPKTIIDLATLTGAIIITLGHEYGGMFANDDSLADELASAGASVGDKLWRMPLGDTYDKLIDSPIADMKNVGPREAGSITAAQFLKRYIDDGVRWAHLDIAGMVWSSKPGATWDKGATGYGVRLLDRFIADTVEK